MKTAIKNLLTDKSFWAAAIALITTVLVAYNVPQGSIEQITALIGAAGTFVAYIVSNGIQTAAITKANAQISVAQIAKGLTDDKERK